MEFYNSYLYTLICKKADFDMLRKAEQVIALCHIQSYLQNDCVGQAITRYETWQNSFPEGIDSKKIPITLQEVCGISDEQFCCMPWIYANVLQELCADEVEPEEEEITAKTELDYMTTISKATWIWENNSSYRSFDEVYGEFMSTEWIQDFLDNMKIPWPLTSASNPEEIAGEVIWPSEAQIAVTPKFNIPAIPASPELTPHAHEPFIDEPEQEPAEVFIEAPTLKGPPKVRDAGYWPFMRCKNVYKAHGGTCRMSHHDLLISLADKFNMSVDVLKKTDPYKIKGIKGLPTRNYY
jgi:hypothetical protein